MREQDLIAADIEGYLQKHEQKESLRARFRLPCLPDVQP